MRSVAARRIALGIIAILAVALLVEAYSSVDDQSDSIPCPSSSNGSP
jgi:hypothetical protein